MAAIQSKVVQMRLKNKLSGMAAVSFVAALLGVVSSMAIVTERD